jgi:hypothetical protein
MQLINLIYADSMWSLQFQQKYWANGHTDIAIDYFSTRQLIAKDNYR